MAWWKRVPVVWTLWRARMSTLCFLTAWASTAAFPSGWASSKSQVITRKSAACRLPGIIQMAKTAQANDRGKFIGARMLQFPAPSQGYSRTYLKISHGCDEEHLGRWA